MENSNLLFLILLNQRYNSLYYYSLLNCQGNNLLNNINESRAKEIVELAEKKEKESNQIVEYTREIKKESIDFKLKIIEILWKIVYSDGLNDNYESNLIRRVCGLLYVSDKDNGIIKLKVKNSIK